MNKEFTAADFDQEALLEVLENQATLETVRELLRSKDIAHSAPSWAEMIKTRLEPALREAKITQLDLIEIIRRAEEHGRKHVRLFQFNDDVVDNFKALLSEKRVETWLNRNGLPQLGEYTFSSYPDQPKVTEVRLGDGSDASALILKIARTEYRRKRSELTQVNGQMVFVAPRVRFRAVDLVKVHTSGLVEVRMSPRTEPPISYSGTATSVLSYLKDLLDLKKLNELSLTTAKNAFSDPARSSELSPNFEVYEAQHKNDRGDRIQSSSQAELGGLLASGTMTEIINTFTSGETDAYCERVRVSYKFNNVKMINAILSDDLNEIVFTAGLSRDEYDTTLGAILKINGG